MKRKIVAVKIGSNVLTTTNGQLDTEVVARITGEICGLKESSQYQFILITSGAVNTGRSMVGSRTISGSETIVKQVLSTVGQPLLMACYIDAFKRCNTLCGQVLLASQDFTDPDRCATIVELFTSMLESGIVPIVNENDAISSEELRNAFTDNDQLGALLAIEIEASKLIILSDIDGFIDGPLGDPTSKVVPVINDISEYLGEIDENAGNGRGGMRSKLIWADKVISEGVTAHIANGTKAGTLTGIMEGKTIGTQFPAKR